MENKKAKLEAPDDIEDRLVTLLTDETAKDRSLTVPLIKAWLKLNDGGSKSGDNRDDTLAKARTVLERKGLLDPES